jgi:hypothetical protein
MRLRREMEEELASNEEACVLEPRDVFDSCIVGIGYRFGDGPLAVYCIPKVLEAMQTEDMDEEATREYFEFNTLRAWMGNGTPLFVELFKDSPINETV